jgi:hypothetical protein
MSFLPVVTTGKVAKANGLLAQRRVVAIHVSFTPSSFGPGTERDCASGGDKLCRDCPGRVMVPLISESSQTVLSD